MRKLRALIIVSLLTGVAATGASATNPSRTWSNFCVSSSLSTCASVQVSFNSVTNLVSMSIWNLGTGLSLNQILTQIGLINNVNIVPIGSTVSGMTGYINGPAPWALFNNQQPNGGGQITLDFLAATGSNKAGNPVSTSNNGIVSSCSSLASSGKYWVSQCGGGTAVSFNFSVASTTGWNLSQSQLYYKVQNGPNGNSFECLTGSTGSTACGATTTPEPVTLTLLATGLGGVALPALRRRRKRRPQVEA